MTLFNDENKKHTAMYIHSKVFFAFFFHVQFKNVWCLKIQQKKIFALLKLVLHEYTNDSLWIKSYPVFCHDCHSILFLLFIFCLLALYSAKYFFKHHKSINGLFIKLYIEICYESFWEKGCTYIKIHIHKLLIYHIWESSY